jgi:hypothetical protein
VWRYWSHWQSWTSVFRPGTFLTWRAFTRQTSKPRVSRSWNRGIQYTPVDSIATEVTPASCSQAARARRSSVKVPKERIGRGSRSSGTQT